MTIATFASDTVQGSGAVDDYQPGICNIGPAEIARRRMAGHVGVVATVGILAALIAIGAPPVTKLVVILPAAVAASGYLQARERFCAAYGSRGVFNFGAAAGDAETVVDQEARELDRRKARRISLTSFAIGALVGLVAFALPI
jgi:hypothetical protein